MRTLKFGNLVGVDKYGNEYYENTEDYPYGQHRWIEYAGDKSFYEVDASLVPPEWHLWLHSVTEEVPTDKKTGSTWRNEPLANTSSGDAPYARNLGGVISSFVPNLSQYRPRAYGQSNNVFPDSKPNEELFYTQPGYPLDKRNKQWRQQRKLSFTLKDNTQSLRTKDAARSGMTPEEYEMASDLSSPARIALLAAKDALPQGSVLSELASKLEKGDGSARNIDFSKEQGTFAAARHEVLTADEEEFLELGYEESVLLNTMAQYQMYIDDYSKIRGTDSNIEEGLEKAQAIRDDAEKKLLKLRDINKKLEQLASRFDQKSYKL